MRIDIEYIRKDVLDDTFYDVEHWSLDERMHLLRLHKTPKGENAKRAHHLIRLSEIRKINIDYEAD